MSLVVDDGTGLPNSESYVSVADATTYHANFGNYDWLNIDVATQETYLRKATRDLDLLLGRSYLSSPLSTTQALLWPRVSYTNTDGFLVSGIPTQLKNAVAELALLNDSVDVTGPADESGNIASSAQKVGDLSVQTQYFAPTSTAPKMRRVNLMIAPLLSGGSTGLYAPVVRG